MISFANRHRFIYFPICITVSFSCFVTAKAKIYSTVLNNSDGNRYPCFVSNLTGKGFNLLPLSVIFCCRLFVDTLYKVGIVPLYF